jgi:hypothetical protein
MLLHDVKLVMCKQYTQYLFWPGWVQHIMSYSSQSEIQVATDYVSHLVIVTPDHHLTL